VAARSRTVALLVVVALATSACNATVAPSAPSPAASGSVAPQSPTSPSATAAPSASGALTAAWVTPAANATIRTSELILQATTTGGSASGIAFKVEWPGGSFAGCRTTKARPDGSWSCTTDLLKAGVPPGPLTVSFDVQDPSGATASGLAPARSITYAAVPPRPVTTYRQVSLKQRPDGSAVEVDRITWTEPDGYATGFRLYGVTGCPNESEATNGQPCLVEHTPLPASRLKLIKTVGGTTRSILLRNVIPPDACGPSLWCGDFGALVLGAYNKYGQSIFAIPLSTEVCFGCTY
jgi:hypothetical protein